MASALTAGFARAPGPEADGQDEAAPREADSHNPAPRTAPVARSGVGTPPGTSSSRTRPRGLAAVERLEDAAPVAVFTEKRLR
jgi:hypothetical protein